MRVYLLALLVSATVAYLMTPLARWCALRWGAITAVRDRDVHAIPTPRLGGMAMFAGILVAILMTSRLPFLENVYANPRPLIGIVGGAAIVCALGVADDIWDLDWLTKLMGQVLAGGFLAWQGVLLYQLPTGSVQTIGSTRMATFLTVLTVVIAMNAVNFVDGLDGLAAGVLAIGGTAFFLYAYLLTAGANPGAYANANLAALVLAALVGACVGFLPHNVYPARLFMGDSGALLLGLLLAAATISTTGNVTPSQVSANPVIALLMPLVVPLAIILLPLVDVLLAVVRRTRHGRRPWQPDAQHLHHRMLKIGHGHRRAVLLLWLWAAVAAVGSVSFVFLEDPWLAAGGVVGLVVVAVVLTVWLPRWAPPGHAPQRVR